MAGQFYAQTEWECLLEALNESNWKIAGKRIRIRVMGSAFKVFTQSRSNFEYLGWLSQEETIQRLSESDLLYLPYWFSEDYYEESCNSFPSKLVTYFAAGRPVFCHAPAYASPTKYIKAHDAGFLCESLQKSIIINKLEAAIQDKNAYSHFAANGNSCFMKDFTLERMKFTFMSFLGNHTKASKGILN
jgi:glycosyltransferase involved in cell wall biosynthesis